MGESILRKGENPSKKRFIYFETQFSKGNPVKIPELDFGMGTVT